MSAKKTATSKKTKSASMGLQEQAREILKKAQEKGVQANFFFVTTFKRYQVQMSILSQLETEIKSSGILVSKEYVKGRANMYTNPAIAEYNKTATAANSTVTTLINILKSLTEEDTSKEKSIADVMRDLLNDD